MKTHHGSCHCRRVTFEVDSDIQYAIDCNCSLCHRRGALWHGASDEHLRILTGESELTLYQFNTMKAKHYFCRHCGVAPFSRPRLDPSRWAFNVRCLEGIDLASIEIRPFDGANWEEAASALMGRKGTS